MIVRIVEFTNTQHHSRLGAPPNPHYRSCLHTLVTCGSNGSCAAYEGAALLVLLLPPLLADADCSGPNESMVIIFDEDIVSVTNTWVVHKEHRGTSGRVSVGRASHDFAHRCGIELS